MDSISSMKLELQRTLYILLPFNITVLLLCCKKQAISIGKYLKPHRGICPGHNMEQAKCSKTMIPNVRLMLVFFFFSDFTK